MLIHAVNFQSGPVILSSYSTCNFKFSDHLVSDIYDGKLYKKQQRNLLSLNMNCDGLPIFKSTVSLWPIQLVITREGRSGYQENSRRS